MLTIYLACAMSGRSKRTLVKQAREDIKTFAHYGIRAISPVLEEHIPYRPGKLKTPRKTLILKLADDKRIMRQSFAIVDRTADMKSEGVQHEIGFMRYGLWRPCIRISPRHDSGYFSIASLEDDLIVGTVEEAAQLIRHKWGTRYKRFKWQMRILNRCLVQWGFDHVRGMFL